jgi:hypothetical protein
MQCQQSKDVTKRMCRETYNAAIVSLCGGEKYPGVGEGAVRTLSGTVRQVSSVL